MEEKTEEELKTIVNNQLKAIQIIPPLVIGICSLMKYGTLDALIAVAAVYITMRATTMKTRGEIKEVIAKLTEEEQKKKREGKVPVFLLKFIVGQMKKKTLKVIQNENERKLCEMMLATLGCSLGIVMASTTISIVGSIGGITIGYWLKKYLTLNKDVE